MLLEAEIRYGKQEGGVGEVVLQSVTTILELLRRVSN